MAAAKRGKNEPEPRPIIVKKIIADGHGGHHGGAWKIAYADFVTAMMAFFLLMWLLGMTDEQKRKGLADYFTPTLVQFRENSAGSNGMLGGDSIIAADNYPHRAAQTGSRSLTIPKDASGGISEATPGMKAEEDSKFNEVKEAIKQRIANDRELAELAKQIRYTVTEDGLRIDLMDRADFSMFQVSTARLMPRAQRLVQQLASAIAEVPNPVIIRGHTDGLPYSASQSMNNWMLSTARAESTRVTLAQAGVAANRFGRIEGVADREPYVPGDRYDPRNRRIAIILGRLSRVREAGRIREIAANDERQASESETTNPAGRSSPATDARPSAPLPAAH